MTPQVPRPIPMQPTQNDLVELLSRAVSGFCEGVMPGARLEALFDHLEMRK